MKKRKPQKPLRQTTLDEFTGGDMLVGASAPGATIKPEQQQGDLFRDEARQLRFELSGGAQGPSSKPQSRPSDSEQILLHARSSPEQLAAASRKARLAGINSIYWFLLEMHSEKPSAAAGVR
jgi:hypothetical protein